MSQAGMVVGGPYGSGVLVGGAHVEYADAHPEIVERVRKIKDVAGRNAASLEAAALRISPARGRRGHSRGDEAIRHS
ncbi:hypothetical protein GCM10010254_68350 [Streptomyces chromofuscus]|nr:hypothetical protein GCM10010254_68350 [Streptomyces chromofuscus]